VSLVGTPVGQVTHRVRGQRLRIAPGEAVVASKTLRVLRILRRCRHAEPIPRLRAQHLEVNEPSGSPVTGIANERSARGIGRCGTDHYLGGHPTLRTRFHPVQANTTIGQEDGIGDAPGHRTAAGDAEGAAIAQREAIGRQQCCVDGPSIHGRAPGLHAAAPFRRGRGPLESPGSRWDLAPPDWPETLLLHPRAGEGELGEGGGPSGSGQSGPGTAPALPGVNIGQYPYESYDGSTGRLLHGRGEGMLELDLDEWLCSHSDEIREAKRAGLAVALFVELLNFSSVQVSGSPPNFDARLEACSRCTTAASFPR
jgi:hypothetical protein